MLQHEIVMSRGERLVSDSVNGLRNNKLTVHLRHCDLMLKHLLQAKSRKYQGVFEVKSRVKTWQVRGIWSQQLKHKQVPQWGTEPGVRKGKRSLLACHTRCNCSMETIQDLIDIPCLFIF